MQLKRNSIAVYLFIKLGKEISKFLKKTAKLAGSTAVLICIKF